MNTLYKLFLAIFLTLGTINLQAQCRDSKAWEDAWTSCEISQNPNAERGQTHWLLYDFGFSYNLSSMQIWNANEIGKTKRGIKTMTLDYSQDGQTWTEFGTVNLNEADGSLYYSGEEAADFKVIKARYVLLTVIETHGDPACASIHEVAFRLLDVPVTEGRNLWVYPNPSADRITLAFDGIDRENVRVQVLNPLGQTMYDRSLLTGTGKQSLKINVDQFESGLYLARIYRLSGEIVGVGKFVVAK